MAFTGKSSEDNARIRDTHPDPQAPPQRTASGLPPSENPDIIPQKPRAPPRPRPQSSSGPSSEARTTSSPLPAPGRRTFIQHPVYSGGASSRLKRPPPGELSGSPPPLRQRTQDFPPPPPPPARDTPPRATTSEPIPEENEESVAFADSLLSDPQFTEALNRVYSKYSAGLFATMEKNLRDTREKLAGRDDLEARLEASQKKLADRERKLAEKEKKLAEVEKKYSSLKKDKKDAQLEALDAVTQKVLRSINFDQKLEGIAAAASAVACHEMYRSLRGWLPGPARLEAQASYYRPKANDLLNHRWRSLQEANLNGLVPQLWESLKMSSRAPSASDIKKAKLPAIDDVSCPDPGPENFNTYGVVPETPHWSGDYYEYCAVPDNFGYRAVHDQEGNCRVGLGAGQDDLLYQSRRATRKVGFPARVADEPAVDAPAYAGPEWSTEDLVELERRYERAHTVPGEDNSAEDNV